MRSSLLGVLVAVSLAAVTYAQTTVKADQGKPGTQGPWPVTISGGLSLDGGSVNVLASPCSRIVQTNDAGIGTSPTRVPPNGGTSGRIWIRVCNSILNASSTQCTCAIDFCPAAVAVGAIGDALATGDCVTYPIGYADAGVPCCVCNGAGSFLPTAECVP